MAAISLTTPGTAYTQNFNALSNTAGSTTNDLNTDPQPLPGWFITETGGGARDNEQYAVDTGSSNTGDIFSYGTAGSTERALGSIQSGTLIAVLGSQFTNNTGQTITQLVISYTGEQWRISNTAAARDDRLDFQISLNATSLASGTWTDVNALDFTNPIKTATAVGALDGNAAANRTAITHTITGLSIAPGATFWIRWNDFNASGGDDALAIDDFSLTPVTATSGESQTVVFDPTSVTLAEGSAGATAYTFTVTRTGGTTGTLEFSGTIAGGTTDSDDFTGGVAPTTFSGSIAAGQASATVTVSVNGDTVIEANESFPADAHECQQQRRRRHRDDRREFGRHRQHHQRRHAGPVDRQRLDDRRRFRHGHLHLYRQPRPRGADRRRDLRHRHRRRQRDRRGFRLCRPHPDQPDHRRGPDQLHVRRHRQRRHRRRAERSLPRQRHQRRQRHGRRRPGHRHDRQQRPGADSDRVGQRRGDHGGQ
jgi:hypothetical protein